MSRAVLSRATAEAAPGRTYEDSIPVWVWPRVSFRALDPAEAAAATGQASLPQRARAPRRPAIQTAPEAAGGRLPCRAGAPFAADLSAVGSAPRAGRRDAVRPERRRFAPRGPLPPDGEASLR